MYLERNGAGHVPRPVVGTRQEEKTEKGVRRGGGKTLGITSACLAAPPHGSQHRLTSSSEAAILVVYRSTLFTETSIWLNYFTISYCDLVGKPDLCRQTLSCRVLLRLLFLSKQINKL